jgi:hypothetical protein
MTPDKSEQDAAKDLVRVRRRPVPESPNDVMRGATCEKCGDGFTPEIEERPPISITTITTGSQVRHLFGLRLCPGCRAERVGTCAECGEFFDTRCATHRAFRVSEHERRHLAVPLRDGAGRTLVCGIDVPRGVYCHDCSCGFSPHQQLMKHGTPWPPGSRGADERWRCLACCEEGQGWILELEHANELAYLVMVGWDEYGLFSSEVEARRILCDADLRRSFVAESRSEPLRGYPDHLDDVDLSILLSCEAGYDAVRDDDYDDSGYWSSLIDDGFMYIPRGVWAYRLTEKSLAMLTEMRARGVLDDDGKLQRFEPYQPTPNRSRRTPP